jgi:hypothetical protein
MFKVITFSEKHHNCSPESTKAATPLTVHRETATQSLPKLRSRASDKGKGSAFFMESK